MLNTDTSLLRTACSVAGEKKHLHVLFKFNPLRIGTFYDPLSLRINVVWLCNYYALLYSNPTKTVFLIELHFWSATRSLLEDHFLLMVRGNARDKVVVY